MGMAADDLVLQLKLEVVDELAINCPGALARGLGWSMYNVPQERYPDLLAVGHMDAECQQCDLCAKSGH